MYSVVIEDYNFGTYFCKVPYADIKNSELPLSEFQSNP